MRANKTTLSVKELQKTIGQWKKRKITDSTEAKLLELYLGLTAYMTGTRVYPVENFYDISVGLRFKNTRCMTEAVRQCGSFGIVPDGNIYGMKAFYSLLWRDDMPENERNLEPDDNPDDAPFAGTLPGTLPGKFPPDSIYYIYPKGEDANCTLPKGENASESTASADDVFHLPASGKSIPDEAESFGALSGGMTSSENCSDKRASPEELTAAVKDFFHLINETPEEKAQMLTPLIDWFELHEKITRCHARDNLVQLVNGMLIPYFACRARFLDISHAGRLCWLSNLLKSPHGQHLLNQAAREGRQAREQEAKEMQVDRRNNHPLCEFEWTDEETGLRFYDDATEGAVNIPADAEPRPSEGAVWNVLRRGWRREGSG